MHCQLCGYEFEVTSLACHSNCPLGSHCNLICCPHCGYQAVDESKSRLAGWIGRILPARAQPENAKERARRVMEEKLVPLSHIPDGGAVEVCSLDEMPARRLARLSVFGLLPGSRVTLVQRHPAPVIRIGETELALSAEILDQIWVRPNAPSGA